jgi:putative oxygen-independent coproporphyrinogen III oxidase
MKQPVTDPLLSADDFGIYIHWPFCESKCPYCDFNSHVAAKIDQARWKWAFLTEIDRLHAETATRRVTSVFFGGGTPSLMSAELVEAVLTAIRQRWSCANSVEVTLEANPGSVERARFEGYREAGVNRVSLGIQALDDSALLLLGRRHNSKDALEAMEIARSTFDRVSIDLIYARQHQTLDQWERELESALLLGTDHVSLYQLTIEEGTTFHKRHTAGKLSGLPDEDLSADMYIRTLEICRDHGLIDYEVSNLAKPGAESRHNMTYWTGKDYLGIGPGAHGRIRHHERRFATEGHRNPGSWLSAVEGKGSGESLRTELTPSEILSERLLMGLRLKQGICRKELSMIGLSAEQSYQLEQLTKMGLLEVDPERVRTSERGRLLLNRILEQIV